MQERQTTIEGTTLPIDLPFLVLATQNPIELEGTYPLPEAEIDRFLFKLQVGYPDEEGELRMLEMKNVQADNGPADRVAHPTMLSEIISAAKKVHVDGMVLRYIRDISLATRRNENVSLGASPRASEHFLRAAKARALIIGRTYVTPDDIKALAKPILLHRLVLTVEAELEEVTTDGVVEQVLNSVPVPRS
jgi:MoxR-like ATPase